MHKALFFLFSLITYFVNAQTLNYKITTANEKIGVLNVVQTEDSNFLQIKIKSSAEIDIIIKYIIEYELNCTYKKNQLLLSTLLIKDNGKVHSTNKITKSDNYYLIDKGSEQIKYDNKIDYSGALLYFKEPNTIAFVFSEFDLLPKPIKSIGIHSYQITNPKNGQKNEYYYKNGILQKVVIHHTLMTFSLIKEN